MCQSTPINSTPTPPSRQQHTPIYPTAPLASAATSFADVSITTHTPSKRIGGLLKKFQRVTYPKDASKGYYS